MMKKIVLALLLFSFFLPIKAQFSFTRLHDIQVTKDALIQKHPWAGGINFCQFANIDLNYDGVEDVFVFDRTGDKVLTFIQAGTAGVMDFDYAPEYEDAFPEMSDWAMLADYNCDGNKDIYTWTAGGCEVYRNTGNATDGLSFELEEPILLYDSAIEPLTFLFMNSQDISSFTDVDGDGDVDILMWLPDGDQDVVEYYKCMSIELYGVCDSLVYEQKNMCWGNFRESPSGFDYSLFDTEAPCVGTLPGEESWKPDTDRSDRHGGGTMLALDLDGSGVMDLIVGDGLSADLAWILNGGTEVNTDSDMDFFELSIPNPDPVNLNQLVAPFYVDVNNDNMRDLIAAPQMESVASNNWESAWWYTNSGADNNPTFGLSGKNFLQGDMMDNGFGAHPIYFDANGDGLKDLLLSSRERHDTTTMDTKGFIYYYENTGTLADPEFTLMTTDYEEISLLDIGAEKNFYPTFGDLDGDGDEDMILGEYVGWLYYMENTGGAGAPAIFNTAVFLEDNTGSFIQRSNAIPKLVDLDHDDDLDMVIAGVDGRLVYYENVGDGTAFEFEFVTDFLGEVDAGTTPFATTWAVPEFIDLNGEWELLVGTINGNIHYYDNIEENIDGAWNQVTSSLENINIGGYSSPAVYDLDEDNRFEMILGCDRGGVAYYESAPISDIGNPDLAYEAVINVYPNPTEGRFTIDLGAKSFKQLLSTSITLKDISGRDIFTVFPKKNKTELDVSNLSSGTYILQVYSGGEMTGIKLIID